MIRKTDLKIVFDKILTRVNPLQLMPEVLSADPDNKIISINGNTISLADRDLYIIGSGKASASMALVVEQIAGPLLKGGMVVSTPNPLHTPEITAVEFGSHPIPDHRSVKATEELLMFIAGIPENSLVLNLVSGGTSSLLCKPAADLTVNDIAPVYLLLIESGAAIGEINAVRKALSGIKGGQLLSRLMHVEPLDLIISDVPDDNPEDIGSGPTIPQAISFIRAYEILRNYKLLDQIPESVRNFLEGGCSVEREIGPMETESNYHQSFIISSARKVARHAEQVLEGEGYTTALDESPWTGPVEELEQHIFSKLSGMGEKSACIFFGECTVEIKGTGKGGRNQELALRMARRLRNTGRSVLFMSAGTDGIDGPTDAAGAVVDQNTWNDAIEQALDPEACLENNDSYTFFQRAGGHIMTGPTGNNVMDLQFLIVNES
jgi:glycerate 2-kinase